VIAWPCTTASSSTPGGPRPTEPPAWNVLSRDVGWLLVASVLSLTMANLTPVIVTGMLRETPAVAAGFATAVVLTRVPLLFMEPIQALVLPRMAAAAAANDRRQLRRDIRLGLGIIAANGVLAVAVAATWVLGERAIILLFGTAAVPRIRRHSCC